MLKTIPKSNISKRNFKVYKEWSLSDSDYAVVSASNSYGSDNYSLWNSINSKYYNSDATAITLFGRVSDLANLTAERTISNNIYTIAIPQELYGEGIKDGSVTILNHNNDSIYSDDGKGNIFSSVPEYNLTSIDFESGELIITDNDGESFIGTIHPSSPIDLESGEMTVTFGTDTDVISIVTIDVEAGLMRVSEPLDFEGLSIDASQFGNIFYEDGLIIINELITSYSLDYRSTKTIYETEVLVSSKAGEFNTSQSPSAVDVVLTNSYDFTTTAIPNVKPAGTIKIKEVGDIKLKSSITGSHLPSVSGSWDDYHTSASIDPTGSYLAPFITTIGLYDDDNNMIAVAKLPKPIKNLPDYDMNFIVRFDT
tara:strand:- start:32 stop:1135 length:1104 start_codon:yes stop_codon:yes gene_type:complete